MLGHLRRSIIVTAVFFVLLGLAYPLAETGIAQALFHDKANGSLTANGSTLIGQTWEGPQWFQGRPDGDDPTVTGGSNLGPRSSDLVDNTRKEVDKLKAMGIPADPDLVTRSGSGVDPDISPEAAYAQVPAVAKARNLSEQVVHDLVAKHVHGRQYGFLGEPYVNVLELNVDLATLR